MGSILVVGVLVGALTGCWVPFGDPGIAPTSLPAGKLGFRVTDGKLSLWTGSPCPGTTEVRVAFDSPERQLLASGPILPLPNDTRVNPGVELEYFTLDDPPPGFRVTEALSPGFDWRAAHVVSIRVSGPEVARAASDLVAPLAREILVHSAQHPADTYFFPKLGWLSRADVAAKDGKEFMTVCTPDPAGEESEIATMGVRVTDGTLRFWTGPPCDAITAVLLTFQPGQADLILTAENVYADVEHLTLGEANPRLTVYRPLSAEFNWRATKSVLLRLIQHTGEMQWSKTTNLAIPIAESAQHAPDTYYFEGVGWLDRAEVLARDGASLRTICGKRPR